MSTDFRALCAELAAELDHNRRCLLDDATLTHPLADRARAALAEPVAEPPAVAERPSDEELGLIYHDCCGGCEFMDQGGFEDAARVVLARWGNHSADASKMVTPAEGEVAELVAWLRETGQLLSRRPDIQCRVELRLFTRAAKLLERHAAPVPVPVSERLPGPEDCDAEERCWLLAPRWILPPCEMTHWLPAHALPLPAPHGGEVEP